MPASRSVRAQVFGRRRPRWHRHSRISSAGAPGLGHLAQRTFEPQREHRDVVARAAPAGERIVERARRLRCGIQLRQRRDQTGFAGDGIAVNLGQSVGIQQQDGTRFQIEHVRRLVDAGLA